MHGLHVIVTATMLAAVAAGCGNQKRPASATTQTTSATWTTENKLQEENARLQKERDDARSALIDERADHARDLERFNADTKARREHDDLEMRALEALTVADVRTDAMRNKARTGSASARKAAEATITDVQNKKATLRAQLQRLHTDVSGTDWDLLKNDIEASIADLDRAVSGPGAPAEQRKAKEQKKKPAPAPE